MQIDLDNINLKREFRRNVAKKTLNKFIFIVAVNIVNLWLIISIHNLFTKI